MRKSKLDVVLQPGSKPHLISFEGRVVPPLIISNRAIQVKLDQNGKVTGEIEILPRDGVKLGDKLGTVQKDEAIHAEIKNEQSNRFVIAVSTDDVSQIGMTGTLFTISVPIINVLTGETRETQVQFRIFSDIEQM